MNNDHEQAHLEQLVFRYLYGDLNEAELQRFQQELDNNPALQARLQEEQALEALLPRGTRPQISDARLQQHRRGLALRAQSSTEVAGAFGLLNWLKHPLGLTAQLAALALAFMLGAVTSGNDAVQVASADMLSPLDLVRDEDYEIYAMQINSFDATTGAIDLSFSLASESHFVGNVADAGVQMLVDVALRNNIDDAGRLEAVEVLRYASADMTVDEAAPQGLIYALNEDYNPGVRYTAATSLAPLAWNENVRVALLQALNEDSNAGVRMVAFDALAEQPDASTLNVFRQRMLADGNEYIRDRARDIVEQFDVNARESARF